ncbi:MAG: DUF924 family protein [Xanthobacteraceae bacterium]|nr:DUF924 family protein [Xanthobacteraceae bacterium]
MTDAVATPDAVLAFWREAGPERWFKADAVFDAEIRKRFIATHEAAAAGQLASWEEIAAGALALVLALDQFPRNLFRGMARAFATDARARQVARHARERGLDREFQPPLRNFFYLPYMHSEEFADQERSVAYMRSIGDEEGSKFAEVHRDVIRRFGRFPHRNEALGRASTPEEIAFLESGGFRA